MGMETVEICYACNGEGYVLIDVGTHNSEYERHDCTTCHGTGKLKNYAYNFKVPFDTEKTKVYDTDSKIMTLIRTIEKECLK